MRKKLSTYHHSQVQKIIECELFMILDGWSRCSTFKHKRLSASIVEKTLSLPQKPTKGSPTCTSGVSTTSSSSCGGILSVLHKKHCAHLQPVMKYDKKIHAVPGGDVVNAENKAVARFHLPRFPSCYPSITAEHFFADRVGYGLGCCRPNLFLAGGNTDEVS